uniref:Histidine-rich glycoprotein n=1 Tax=Chelonoidis abingdonii TaxID=106734 RepID=A0A8C0ISI4_CHEAB
MKLLSTALCLTLLLCSDAQSQTPVTSADCDTVETDAGVALDLINKDRRDGYIFTLFRVADAHEQQTENSSVFYLTLDVLETQCSVLSRRHWEACKLSQHNEMCDRPPFHHHPCSREHHHHLFSGKGHPPVGLSHRHHHHHHPGFGPGHPKRYYHRCPPAPGNRVLHPEGSEHHHNFSEEEHQHGPPHLPSLGPRYPPPPLGTPHHRHHHPGFGPGHPKRYYHRCPPPPENRVLHPEGSEHHHNFSEEEHQHGPPHLPSSGPRYPPPPPGTPHHRHHHPGFGPGHPKRYYHRCPPPPENRVLHPERSEHHHNFSGEEYQHGPPHLPPPPGPHYPPPPYGCKPHHRHIHLHHQESSNFSQERGDDSSSSEEHISSKTLHPFHKRQVGSIHHIPVLNQHDVLPAPAANFSDPPPAARDPFCKYLSEKPAIQPFPQAPSESRSCPGKPKYDLPDLLPLFPHRSTQ